MPTTPRAGAAVAGQIPASAAGEVGRGWRLGQHGEVGDSFEAHRGGEAHRRGLSAVAAARWRGSLVLGRRSGRWHRWSG
jgi:hypothetical protein